VKLSVELESDNVMAGETVSGHVNVDEGGASRALTLTLTFNEETRDFAAVPYSSGGVLHEGALATGEKIPFTFVIPAAAPPSLRGEHSELYWELRISSDHPGRNTSVLRRLVVRADAE
jgi:hypothetical protein